MIMRVKPQSVKGAIILIAVIVAIITVLTYTGITHTRSALQIGYIGISGWSSWSGHYELLDGNMRKTLHFKETQDISLKVETESGALSVEIKTKREISSFRKAASVIFHAAYPLTEILSLHFRQISTRGAFRSINSAAIT